MKHKIARLFLGNLWLKILSLGIAFLIWMIVSNANNPVKTQLFTNIPITIVNQDFVADIGKVVEPEGDGTVTLKVTDRKSVLQTLSRSGSDFYVEADMKNLSEMNTVPLTVTCSNSMITWDKIEIAPASLQVTLEDKVEQTYVASVSPDGEPSSGLEVGTTSIRQGKNIVIDGPRSLMNIINQVVAPINVAGLGEDASVRSTLKVYDKNGDAFTDSQMASLEIKDASGNVLDERQVTVKVDLWKVKTDVPIKVKTTGTPAWGCRVAGITTIPETISVAGTDAALRNLGDEFDVAEPIDVEGADQNVTQEINLTDTLENMEGLKLITDADPSVQVTAVIEQNGDVTLQVPLSNIKVSGRPDGMTLVFTPADAVTVKVRALSSDAARLSQKDVTLSVDLSACAKEGSYELPVSVSLPSGYELAGDVTLKVSSTKQEVQTEAGE